MPTGILGTADVAATTLTTLYTVPATKIGVVNINLCNRGTAPVKVRLAVSATATPALGEYIEYDATIAANSVLERTGFALDTGKNVVVYTDIATLSAVVTGFEE